jgi:uncharacterized protein YndB with AHSA1/START domain
MTGIEDLNEYVELSEPATVTLQRLVRGPVDTVWAYLTKSDLRRQWLAAGEMELAVGALFDLTWRNDELTDPPGRRPDGFPGVHVNQNRILAVEPNRCLSFAFGNHGEVTFELEPRGSEVLVTLNHRGVPDRATLLMISPSWHNHLDLLVARLAGRTPAEPYWDKMNRLRADYERRLAV